MIRSSSFAVSTALLFLAATSAFAASAPRMFPCQGMARSVAAQEEEDIRAFQTCEGVGTVADPRNRRDGKPGDYTYTVRVKCAPVQAVPGVAPTFTDLSVSFAFDGAKCSEK